MSGHLRRVFLHLGWAVAAAVLLIGCSKQANQTPSQTQGAEAKTEAQGPTEREKLLLEKIKNDPEHAEEARKELAQLLVEKIQKDPRWPELEKKLLAREEDEPDPKEDDEPPRPIKLDRESIIAEIERLGGEFETDDDRPGSPIVTLKLKGKKITNAWLEHLRGLPALEEVSLWNTRVGDQGLLKLQPLKRLRTLRFQWQTRITDAGLKNLTALVTLEELELEKSKVTDAGLTELKQLPRLGVLRLNGAKATDEGVDVLQEYRA